MTGPEPSDGGRVELLAALDAGLLDPELARTVRAAAVDDPASMAVLGALALTRAQLAAQPELTVPPEVAARWATALVPATAEPADRPRPGWRPAGRPTDRWWPAGRPADHPADRRADRLRRVARPLVSALALAGVLVGVLLAPPVGPAEPDVLRLARIDLAAVGATAVGVVDIGELADPARRATCLGAVGPPIGVAPDAAVLGGRRVLMDGRPGLLLVLSTGELGRFRIVVVDPACGRSGGTLLAEATIGR